MSIEIKGMTIRFLEVIQKMKISHAYLCDKIYNKKPSYLSNVNSHRQNASIEMIVGLLESFPNINANYILTGRGDMFNYDNLESENYAKQLGDKIEKLQSELKQSYEEIGRLNMELKRLKL